VQGTAEGTPFSREHLGAMLDLAASGVARLTTSQHDALGSRQD
jgi:ribonuclease PH